MKCFHLTFKIEKFSLKHKNSSKDIENNKFAKTYYKNMGEEKRNFWIIILFEMILSLNSPLKLINYEFNRFKHFKSNKFAKK